MLAKRVAAVGAAAPGASVDSMEASDAEAPREYTSIIDALVAISGLPKMATTKFNYRTMHPSFFTEVELEKEKAVISAFHGTFLDSEVLAVLKAADTLIEAIEKLGLGDAWSMPPLLSGDVVKNVLTKIPRGTAFGQVRYISPSRSYLCHDINRATCYHELFNTLTQLFSLLPPSMYVMCCMCVCAYVVAQIMQRQIRWMLCNPQGTAEQLSEYLKNTYPEYV